MVYYVFQVHGEYIFPPSYSIFFFFFSFLNNYIIKYISQTNEDILEF